MLLFSRPGPTAAELGDKLHDVGGRLDRLASALEAHCTVTAEHGKRLEGLPEAVVVRAVEEARAAAKLAVTAAWLAIRRKALEEALKWGWRAAFAGLAVKALAYLNDLAGTVHLGGGS